MCVPCFNPVDGKSTGACELGGDPGPVEPATLFGACCEGAGRCIPSGIIEEDLQSKLAPDTCNKATGSLCVPDLWVDDQSAFPASCHGHDGAEGRCLSRCLPDVIRLEGRLLQDTCDASQACVPCFDSVTGEDTGACSSGSDPGPSTPPVLFDKCCGDIGRCVPNQSLKESEKGQLSADGCSPDSNTMCVPANWITNAATPPQTCRAFGEIEGRCMPSCLPGVADRAEQLRQNNCPNSHLCVPCFDPVTLENTGACTVGSDPGPAELPVSFSLCCEGLGRCVPTEAVDEESRTRLDANICTPADNRLCVPEPWVKSAFFTPESCTAPGGLEARCLPACLPDVAKRSDNLTQETCAGAHLCVPCFDPVTGEATHACEVGRDKPVSTEPQKFPSCCGDTGLCVPGELVPSGDRSRFGADSCNADSGAVCVPNAWVGQDTPPVPTTCRSHDNAEGRCMSRCLPEVAARAGQLPQDACTPNELCVPCFDPVDGSDTQACRVSGDAPKEAVKTFDMCCGGKGRCVPPDVVSSERRSELGPEMCADQADLCVPGNWLGESPAAAPACRGLAGGEGRCLPTCLPGVAAQADKLVAGGCEASSLCVPCFDPVSGDTTGACNSPGDPGPSESPRTFPTCCDGIGKCVPNAMIDPGNLSHLSAERCNDPSANVCVPTVWLSDTFTTPKECRAPGNVEGRCLAECLPEVANRAENLRQTSCMGGELCVPCFDPLTGGDTGACSFTGDLPRESPKVYQPCCTGDGICIPGELLPPLGAYNADSCAEPNSFCVPSRVANGFDPVFSPCTDSDLRGGACVPSCYVNPFVRLLVSQDTCLQGGTMCVSCGLLSLETQVCR